MKYISFFFLFLYSFLAVQAQTVTISDEIPLRDGDSYQMLGKYKGKNLLYIDNYNDISIIAYNDDMTEEWRKELDFEVRNPNIIDVLGGQEDFTIIYRFSKRGDSYLWARKYDDKAKLIDSTQIATTISWATIQNYQIEMSQDRSKALIYSFKSFGKLELILFDLTEMKTLWTKDLKLDKLSYQNEFLQLVISNDGVFYAIFLEDNFRFRRKKTRFIILRADEQNTTLSPYPTNQKLIFGAHFEMDNRNQRLTGGGLFDEKRNSRAQGAFFLSIQHQNPKSYTYNLYNFDAAFVSSIEGEKEEKKETFNEAVVNNMILRQDGGVVLVAEKFKIFSNGITDSPFRRNRNRAFNPRSYTDYNYDDILLVSFNPRGQVDWKGTLPKKQFSQNDEGRYSSYFIFKNRGAVRFLYNDEIKRENSVSEYLLFSNGTNQRKNILNTDDKKIKLRFKDAVQIAGSELLVPSQFRKDLRLVRIKY